MKAFVETKVEFLGSIFKGSSSVSKQAICYNPREGLILPVNAFLFDRRFNQGKSWRTVEAGARSLCQWWDFLYLKRMDYREADVDDLRDFIISGGTRYGNVVRFPGTDPQANFDETTAAKADTILSFYKFLKHECDLRLHGEPGETLGDVRRKALGRVRYHEQEGQDADQPTFAYPRSENPRLRHLRPTPTPEEATEIIKATANAHRPFHVHTYYLIASLFRFGGLRAGGCESLTLSGFFGAMVPIPMKPPLCSEMIAPRDSGMISPPLRGGLQAVIVVSSFRLGVKRCAAGFGADCRRLTRRGGHCGRGDPGWHRHRSGLQ